MNRGLFVGRFQPFHVGHLSVVEEMDKAPDLDEIVIGIGSSQYNNEHYNPFSAAEREEMIRRTLEDMELATPYRIVQIPDIHDYPQWVPHVISTAPEFRVIYVPGNTIVRDLFEQEGYEVRSPEFVYDVSATRIRELMLIEENWQDYVPDQVRQFIDEINGVERVIDLGRKAGVNEINPCDIVVIPRLSQYEWDMHHLRLTHKQLIDRYQKEGQNIDEIMQGHKELQDAIQRLREYFSEDQFVHKDNLTRDITDSAKAVISLGGDDHAKYVSHFMGGTLFIGLNPSPTLSEGALTYFTLSDLEQLLPRLERAEFSVEKWIRLEAELDGKLVELALSEYFIGEDRSKYMSGHVLQLGNENERQRSSGLMVVTGAGSTGWYDSACRYIFPHGNKVPKNEEFARYVNREPSEGRLTGYNMLEGRIAPGEELIVKSLNRHKGILSPDSIEDYDFGRGSVVKIRISDKPLKVVAPM